MSKKMYDTKFCINNNINSFTTHQQIVLQQYNKAVHQQIQQIVLQQYNKRTNEI
jgi:hypothetical protein